VIFTPDEFLAILEQFNRALGSLNLVAYALGVAAILLALWKGTAAGQGISGLLGTLWVCTGLVFHIFFFRSLTSMALVFGAAFILQGGMLFWSGVMKQELRFSPTKDIYGIVGWLLIVYSMIGYPLIGNMLGHGTEHSLAFGITSGPLVVFSFGLLLWVGDGLPRHLMFIPFVAGMLESIFLLSSGMYEDIGAGIAALAGSLLIIKHETAATALRLKSHEIRAHAAIKAKE
jgi:hypothetical protein